MKDIKCVKCNGEGWKNESNFSGFVTPEKCKNCGGKGYFPHPLSKKPGDK